MMGSKDDNQKKVIGSGIDRLIHEPARYTIMAHLFVADTLDYLFLINQTGLTWGNLPAHVNKLEAAGYVSITKEFLGKKPHSMITLTTQGRDAFAQYQQNMKQMLEKLP